MLRHIAYIFCFLTLVPYSNDELFALQGEAEVQPYPVQLWSLKNRYSHKEIDLSRYEKSICSQNGEDGVIEAIFNIIGTSSKYYVEFGANDGEWISNTKYLRKKFGWNGLLLDCDFENPSINLHKEFITAQNINDLFEKYKIPEDFDLLSIDIDYNDFHVWQALEAKYRPRLVVIEYNATHLPWEDKVVKYDPSQQWDGSNYSGASILSFYKLARKKGYSLVYAESVGVNLFFIRDDVLEGQNYRFKNINEVEKIYRAPTYGQGPNGGHPADPIERKYVESSLILSNE